jgi:transcriptional regulator with XRE-family HTH domain
MRAFLFGSVREGILQEVAMLVNLKAALAMRRTTQAELAAELKISTGLLSEVIHGRKQLAPHQKARASEFLSADESWLFAETRIPALRPLNPTETSSPTAATAAA